MKKKNINPDLVVDEVESEVIIGRVKPKIKELLDTSYLTIRRKDAELQEIRSNIRELSSRVRRCLQEEAETKRSLMLLKNSAKATEKTTEKKASDIIAMIKRRKDVVSVKMVSDKLVFTLKGFIKEINDIKYLTPATQVLFDFERRNVYVRALDKNIDEYLEAIGGRINPFLENGAGWRRLCLGETEGAFNTSFIKSDLYSLLNNVIMLLKSDNVGNAYCNWENVASIYQTYFFKKQIEKVATVDYVRVKDSSIRGSLNAVYTYNGEIVASVGNESNVPYRDLIDYDTHNPLPELNLPEVIKI